MTAACSVSVRTVHLRDSMSTPVSRMVHSFPQIWRVEGLIGKKWEKELQMRAALPGPSEGGDQLEEPLTEGPGTGLQPEDSPQRAWWWAALETCPLEILPKGMR